MVYNFVKSENCNILVDLLGACNLLMQYVKKHLANLCYCMFLYFHFSLENADIFKANQSIFPDQIRVFP